MVFNIAIHNRDDHAKNVAFLMDRAGEWRLAPAYDLTVSDGPGGEHIMDVGGEGKAPARADALRVAERSGLRKKRALVILEEVCDGLSGVGAVLRENGVRPSEANRIAALFEGHRAALAGIK